MIKKCEVILRNALIMVVKYNEQQIQFPRDNTSSDFVFVENLNGHYTLATEKEFLAQQDIYKKSTETELVNDVVEKATTIRGKKKIS